MGLLNDIWWLSGFVLAAPLAVVGVDYLGRANPIMGGGFLALALAALLLPEYVRWRLFGGSSVLEKVPLVRGAGDEKA
jgi:hypothetical protein